MENEYISFYKYANVYLLKLSGITNEDISRHLVPIFDKPDDIKVVYRRFVDSAQNMQSSSNVIGASIGGTQNLETVLFDFDPVKVAEHYTRADCLLLFENIKNTLKPKGQLRATTRSIWPKFCHSVIDSAYFLSNFNTGTEFHAWTETFGHSSLSKPAIPLILSEEIFGIGFALACDILKELGHTEFGKPDIHIKEILKGVGFLDVNINGKQEVLETMRILDRIAIANEVSPFNVDKILWLIGSGKIHDGGKTIGRNREEFIKAYLAQNK